MLDANFFALQHKEQLNTEYYVVLLHTSKSLRLLVKILY